MYNEELAIQKKNEIQEIAVKGSKGWLRLLLTWATGCGKSLAALKIIKEDYDDNPNLVGYLICAESNHTDNWRDDIKKHGMEEINDCMTTFLYASLHKYSPKGYVDFVILDEVHHITEKRLEHLREIIGPETRVVMLSATVNNDKMEMLKRLAKPFGQYHISISEAIDMGILPTPTVYIHYYKLDDTVKDRHVRIERFGEVIVDDYFTEKGAYEVYTKQMEYYRDIFEAEAKMWARNLWVNTGSKRKRLLAEFKTQRAKKLLRKEFVGTRHIVFTGSIPQANKLGRNVVHSEKSKVENLHTKNKFNRKQIKSLTMVNMFREGMNLVNIEKGLIVQLDNVKLSFVQMLGRVFRSEIPEMHIIVFEDTQDEKYLDNVTWGFNQDYLKHSYEYES